MATNTRLGWPALLKPASYDWAPAAKGGLIGGLVGGVVLSLYMLLANLAQGLDLWMAAKGAGMPFLGERATQPGFDALAVAVGLLSHFAVSVVWGTLFGLLASGLSRSLTVAAGAAYGVVVWLTMFYVVLPVLGLGAMAREVPIGLAILEHVAFGFAVALGFLPFQRPIARTRSP